MRTIVVRRKTAPDFLVENMILLIKQFLNPAPKTPAVRGGRIRKRGIKHGKRCNKQIIT